MFNHSDPDKNPLQIYQSRGSFFGLIRNFLKRCGSGQSEPGPASLVHTYLAAPRHFIARDLYET